jgi:cyclophilin family peptidyl-prolyl cis-trans isomerase
MQLFENTVPRTAENFRRLLLGTASYQGRSLSLINNHFFRQVPRAYAELGHLAEGNCSIFGPTFRDESFELPHDRPGLLSCVSEENTNNSRFLITYAPCPFLDLKNVVFGEVTAETLHQLRTLERLGDSITQFAILSTKQAEIKEEHHDEGHGHAHGH